VPVDFGGEDRNLPIRRAENIKQKKEHELVVVRPLWTLRWGQAPLWLNGEPLGQKLIFWDWVGGGKKKFGEVQRPKTVHEKKGNK